MATPIVQTETNVSCKNVQGTFDYIYEDEQCVVFNEQNPLANVHFVVVPKKIISSVSKVAEVEETKILGHLMIVARNMALQNGLDKTGYHVMMDENYNDPIPRLMSLHVFGRALHHMLWPVGPGCKL